jgi:hypothetical protein
MYSPAICCGDLNWGVFQNIFYRAFKKIGSWGPGSLMQISCFEPQGFWRKYRKRIYSPKPGWIEQLMVPSESAFQWMVMSLGFDNLKIFWAISVSRPRQKSPSVLKWLKGHFKNINNAAICSDDLTHTHVSGVFQDIFFSMVYFRTFPHFLENGPYIRR